MNRIHSTHRVTPLNRRFVSRLLLTVLVTHGAAAACTSGGADSDEQVSARLSTGAAGELLSSGFTPSESRSTGFEALMRPAPTGPPPGELTADSLGVDFGTSEAPLRLVEFFDYGCGYCRGFHRDTRGPLLEEYVDPGQIFWKSIPFIIGNWPASLPVSLAAECARAQGRDYFEAISNLIFEHQSEWKATATPEELAEGYAVDVGLDMPRYRTCFENDELLWRVQAQTRWATDLGIRGTPTFFIVGFGPIQGALPLDTFREIFDTLLVDVAAEQP